jgi:hypothetical protein
VKYFLDQQSHPESVFLRPGGNFDGCVIAGQIGTISDDKWSIALFRVLRTTLRKNFEKIKSYLVGKSAAKFLDAGGRLTANVRSPTEYDLVR